jgi:tetratricopeptide (TPR) repeat protein
MKTSKVRKETTRKRLTLSAVAIISTLCITMNALPKSAESAALSEKDDSPEIVVEVTDQVNQETMVEQNNTELARGYVRAAQAFANLYQYKEGLPWAEEAIRLDPELSEAHLIYGYLNFKLVNSKVAISSFEKTLELEPTSFEAYLYLGIIYRGTGDPDLGIEYFNQAMEVAATDEDLSTAYAERGLAYGNLDRYEKSYADFETALSVNPDNGWAIFFRGIVSEKEAEQEVAQSGQDESLEMGADLGFGS